MTSPKWYYVKGNDYFGPYSETKIKQFFESRELLPDTYVWKEGIDDWIPYRDSELYVDKPSAEFPDSDWANLYYKKGKRVVGPFTVEEIKKLCSVGFLELDTYIRRESGENWILLRDFSFVSSTENIESIPDFPPELKLQMEIPAGPPYDFSDRPSSHMYDDVIDDYTPLSKPSLKERIISFLQEEETYAPDPPSDGTMPKLKEALMAFISYEEVVYEDDKPVWYFLDGMQPKGPFTQEEMDNFLAKKKINLYTPVYKEGASNWIPYQESELNEIPVE